MNDTLLHAILLIGFLALVGRGVLASRIPFATIIGSLLTWGAIAALLIIGYNHRDDIDRFFAKLTGNEAQQTEGSSVRLRMARDGHFWADVKLNGVEKRMLIDSGATSTSISAETAQAAGIEPQAHMPRIEVSTANGIVEASRGVVATMELGGIKSVDQKVIVSEAFGDTDVIGMNFLSSLKSWRVEGKELVMEPHGMESDQAE